MANDRPISGRQTEAARTVLTRLVANLRSLSEARRQLDAKIHTLRTTVEWLKIAVGSPETSSSSRGIKTFERSRSRNGPDLTAACYSVVESSRDPLTIGEICSKLTRQIQSTNGGHDPLLLVSTALHALAKDQLVGAAEYDGIRKWEVIRPLRDG